MLTRLFAALRNFFAFRTLRMKLMTILTVSALGLLLFMHTVVLTMISQFETQLIMDHLHTDINYIQDLLSPKKDASWNIRGKTLYYGDTPIGDGTEARANIPPFLEHERKTGTFAYIFKLDSEAVLGYVQATETTAGYEEGHYLRIAGSTKSPDGKSIVGTYISKRVADSLDRYGVYSGEANVAGGMIYCLYQALVDKDGNTVGAVVVGRNITDLEAQIADVARKILSIMVGGIAFGYIVIFLVTSRLLRHITHITEYLHKIEEGIIPDKSLHLTTSDEMNLIADSINNMVASLKENIVLRKKSETDALTGLANRFAYDRYVKYIDNQLRKTPQTLAVEIIDIDYFKQYNDNYGHQAGDKCIESVAREIHGLVTSAENIFACRYGGDEFVILYTGYSRDEVRDFTRQLAQRIAACNIAHRYSKVASVVTITQGLCFDHFSPDRHVEDFFLAADSALYDVKKTTRNACCIVNLEKDDVVVEVEDGYAKDVLIQSRS
ncbi:MAG: diguanylate cyclase domain-containing protein [Schwartzia sp. (in: firmicutes)]